MNPMAHYVAHKLESQKRLTRPKPRVMHERRRHKRR